MAQGATTRIGNRNLVATSGDTGKTKSKFNQIILLRWPLGGHHYLTFMIIRNLFIYINSVLRNFNKLVTSFDYYNFYNILIFRRLFLFVFFSKQVNKVSIALEMSEKCSTCRSPLPL